MVAPHLCKALQKGSPVAYAIVFLSFVEFASAGFMLMLKYLAPVFIVCFILLGFLTIALSVNVFVFELNKL